MADLKENQMKTGTPSYLRGVASNGDGLRVNKEMVRNFIGVYVYKYDLQPGEEIELGQLGYSAFILTNESSGSCALYISGSYPRCLVFESWNGSGNIFGDFVTGSDRRLIFGRKESNSSYILKNNSDLQTTVTIRRLHFG